MMEDHGETIEEQRKVEGFGDPQYTCSDEELAVRHAIYTFFQNSAAAGIMTLKMTQDWQGNTLHVNGEFRPMLLAKRVVEYLDALNKEKANGKVDAVQQGL
jgi:hypothetical protein